jgi:hypothetical protein
LQKVAGSSPFRRFSTFYLHIMGSSGAAYACPGRSTTVAKTQAI